MATPYGIQHFLLCSTVLTLVPNDKLVESVLDVELKAPFTIGLMLSSENPPKITKLMPSSCFLGKLFVGDIVLAVNEQKVGNIGDFFKYCKAGKVAVRYKRDEYCTTTIKTLPRPRPDVESFEFQMVWRTGGMPIGILVYHDQDKRVIVSMVENGTIASHSVRPGDILTKINDIPVKDKEVAKKTILDSVNNMRRVKLTIERSGCLDTTHATPRTPGEVIVIPQIPRAPNFDLPLPPDVLAIMDANRDFHRKPYAMPAIIKRTAPGAPVSSGNGAKLSIPDCPPEENVVEFDPSEKPLKATPKRVGTA
uniref:PDZ domain-containing protein n=1 Tax=Steinernema glaseri TaxID=37863 RepID=A0A1I7XX75_9BILA